MNKISLPPLAPLVQNFFCQRLQAQQQVSLHTLASYRDTIRLLMAFVEKKTARPPSQQTLQDWNAPTILSFLDYVQKERNCQARTRNTRLAALRAFMRYTAQQAPETLGLTSQVLAIPIKRYDCPLIQPLSVREVEAIFAAIDQATQSGRRDHLLFSLLYYTGARISEALQLRQQDVYLDSPSTLTLHGKGRKKRVLPLHNPLAQHLKRALALSPHSPSALLFQNRFGQQLTRWGVEKRLQKTVQRAAHNCASLQGRTVSPHTFRHTAATRLVEADVDIMVIALLLGHESTTTTHKYVELDLQMKERWLRKIQSPRTRNTRFKPTDALLNFLQSL